MSSGEGKRRWVWLWWPGLVLSLIGAGCGPLALGPSSRLAGNDIEGYEAPGVIDYPPALLKKVAASLAAEGRYARGPVYGIAMQEALRGLQADQGLAVTGRLDAETLLALGIDPALLPGGLEPLRPGPFSRQEPLASPNNEATPSSPPDHSPGRLSVRSPLAHLAAPVAALAAGGKVFCTGFLVGPDLLLTAARCLARSAPCGRIVARFDFQEDGRGRPLPPADYRCRDVVAINKALGYGLLRLAGSPGYDWGYLELTGTRAEEDEPLALIGHPAGTSKRIFEECRATSPVGGRDFGFSCDTRIDMPGAPVISRRSRRVMAMLQGRIVPEKRGKGTSSRRLLASCPACEPPRLGNGLLDLGDGGRDFFLRRRGRLGLLRSRRDGWTINWLPAGWLDEWNLPGRYRAYAVDIDGDGKNELLLKNSRWLAIFQGKRGKPRLFWIAHDRIGRWQLGDDDRAWPGDFNGDGRTDLLMFDGRRLGLLLAKGHKLTCPWRSGRRLGTWRFSRADRFLVGDFNGDGRSDVLVCRGAEAAVFLSRGERLDLVWTAVGRIGSWKLTARDEHDVGDFTGDGCDEVLVRRDREMALWKMEGGAMELQWRRQGFLGSWPLGWQDRLHIADFNGDGRDDILIRSNAWIGLLLSSGRYFTTPWLRFGRFQGWDLTPFDRELVGDFNGDGKADLLILGPRGSARFLSTGTGFVRERAERGLALAPGP